MPAINTPEDAETFRLGLRAGSDQWVIQAYEAASSTFDEDAMALCLEEMKRRNLDF